MYVSLKIVMFVVIEVILFIKCEIKVLSIFCFFDWFFGLFIMFVELLRWWDG